jgi:hypothetical protein
MNIKSRVKKDPDHLPSIHIENFKGIFRPANEAEVDEKDSAKVITDFNLITSR